MTGIEHMAMDFERAMDEFTNDVRAQARRAAEHAASEAALASSPLYGIGVRTSVSQIGDASRVTAEVVRTEGVGTVFGGMPYADKRVRGIIDKALREAGFDIAG